MKKILISISALFLLANSVLASDCSCKKHIELHPASYLAREYGKSEMWILQNIKINLWQKPSFQGKGQKVGQLLPGSRALILKEEKEDYKVKSPYDKSVGWINKIQVKRTLFQDPETREACKKHK